MQVIAPERALRCSPLFADLKRDTLEHVAAQCQERRYASRQRIVTEGDGSGQAELHIVVSGVVRIFKRSFDGRELVLSLMRRGDTLGEAAVFDGGPYPASAEAQEPTVVLALAACEVRNLARTDPAFSDACLRLMAGRLRQMTTMAEDLALRRVMSRVSKLLLTDPDAAHLTQAQIAAMVGSTREVVNRSLHSLSGCGAIELHGQSILVTDPEQLRLIAHTG